MGTSLIATAEKTSSRAASSVRSLRRITFGAACCAGIRPRAGAGRPRGRRLRPRECPRRRRAACRNRRSSVQEARGRRQAVGEGMWHAGIVRGGKKTAPRGCRRKDWSLGGNPFPPKSSALRQAQDRRRIADLKEGTPPLSPLPQGEGRKNVGGIPMPPPHAASRRARGCGKGLPAFAIDGEEFAGPSLPEVKR